MIQSHKSEIDMTSGNLFTKILSVSVPLMLTGILQLLYNAADLVVCGKWGSENAVAAISATGSLINLIVQLFLGLSVGASVLMARCYGSQNKEKASKVVHTSIFLAFIIGIVIGIFGISCSHIFLKWMNTPIEVIDLSTQYLFIYFMGLPFSMVYNFGAALLRSTGDTKHPFYYLTIAGIVNVLLNLFLVIVCKLDVAGVAIATITSQAISSILVLIRLCKDTSYCHFSFKQMRIYKTEVKEMLRIGIPAGVQGTLFSVSNVLIQSSINSLGTDVMNGNGASVSLEGFVYTCMNAIAQTSISFIGANYGASNVKNIKKSFIYSLSLIMIFGLSLGSIVSLCGKPLLHIYLDNQNAIDIGYQRLLVICLTYFLCGLMDTIAYALRGLGYSFIPMIVTLCGVCGLRIVWIYTIFQLEPYHNLLYLSISYPVSWLITAVVQFILYLVISKGVFKKLQATATLN